MSVRKYDHTDRRSVAALDVDTQVQTFAEVQLQSGMFSWQERPLAHSVVKHHDLPHYLEETPPTWDQALVEILDHRVRGFAAYAYSRWNRRIVLLHMYVDAGARGQGIGRSLLDEILSAPAARSAQHVWLETQTNNVPAIRAYERMGFRVVGLDQTLYEDRPGAETALYMSRQLND
ncbi:MAG: GNAT family N-acetyltransferase [Microlunatus sp.]